MQAKPFESYNQLLQKMATRGLDVGSRDAALAALKKIGYYRLSGYTYPYRMVVADTRGVISRTNDFTPGLKLAEVLALYNFDARLRLVLLGGLQTLEIGLGAAIAHALGKLDPCAQLDPIHLQGHACSTIAANGRSEYENWRTRYDELIPKADRGEQYVTHHVQNSGLRFQ